MFKQAKDINPLPPGMADAFSRELHRQGFADPVQESPAVEPTVEPVVAPEPVSESVAKDLDKVDPKATKKSFDDREDKDIDNDGDVDSSDEYLHKRRKAIAKAIGMKEEIDLDEGKMSELQDYIDQGKTAEWIAKKIGFPVKDVKAFMSKYEAYEEVSLEESSVGWIAIYKSKKLEIVKGEGADQATDMYSAKQLAIKKLKVPKSGQGILSITPAHESYEGVALDEAAYTIKDGEVHISKANFRKIHKDLKDTTKGDEMMMIDGGKKGSIMAPVVFEEVDLEESPKYKLYHNTFSGAVQEAQSVAEQSGFEVDSDDWDSKVATGPAKPKNGKTNTYSIKLTKNGKSVKQSLQIQVYNMGAKYELNCYIQ